MSPESQAAIRATQARARLWSVVRDANAPVDDRIEALAALIAEHDGAVAEFIVEQLEQSDAETEWQQALVLAAEQIAVPDSALRRRLTRTLYNLASRLRTSTDQGVEPIVHSAIRCCASLLPGAEVTSLLLFLEPPSPIIETRVVALLAIAHLFEAERDHRCVPTELADRVYELACKFLDKDWLVPGTKAAIGQCAVYALAAMGDCRLVDCIQRVNQLGLPWLRRQVAVKLESLVRTWEQEEAEQLAGPLQLVREQLEELRRGSSD